MVEIDNKDAEQGTVKADEECREMGNVADDIETISASCVSTTFATLPEPKAKLHLSEGFCFEIFETPPNLWWRLWHWVFFGIKWERIEE